jgi:Alcohol dehydrogenase GroES-like domain
MDRSPRLATRAGRDSSEGGRCGVCRTDLHVVDGELPDPKVPIIPGHEIVGRIDAIGARVEGLGLGERVGIPWLGHTCGVCDYCVGGQENLCDRPLLTGYTRDGGFATTTIADARYAVTADYMPTRKSLEPYYSSTGLMLGWLMRRGIEPHIPILNREHLTSSGRPLPRPSAPIIGQCSSQSSMRSARSMRAKRRSALPPVR